jgi:hypothetical protein
MNDKDKKIKKYLGEKFNDVYFNKKKVDKTTNDFEEFLEEH